MKPSGNKYNDFRNVYAKRGVGQLADALIRPDLSRQAKQARQVRQRSGQRPGSQTRHLCMFQRSRAIKHYTCACPSAPGTPDTTPVHTRVLTEHKTLRLCTFERSSSILIHKGKAKAHVDIVARFQDVI